MILKAFVALCFVFLISFAASMDHSRVHHDHGAKPLQWPQTVGKTSIEAVEMIKNENPSLHVVVLNEVRLIILRPLILTLQ